MSYPENNPSMKDSNYNLIRKVCKSIIGLSIVYLILRLVPIDVLVVSGVMLVTAAVLLKVVWGKLREKGLISFLSPRLQNTLLHKSIFDIYSDLVYFPFISEIVKAFITPMFTKPPPQKLFSTFSELPPKIRDGIATKGLLHLAPQKVQNLMLKSDWTVTHEDYGKVDSTWYNYKHYNKVCLVKPPKLNIKETFIHKITSVKWHYLLVLSVVMMLVGRKYSQIQIRKFLAKKGIQFGAILFAISLAFEIKKFLRPTVRHTPTGHSGESKLSILPRVESIQSLEH